VRPFALPALGLAALAYVAACGGGSDGGTPPTLVDRVEVTPPVLQLQLGLVETGDLVATARDRSGVALSGRMASWTSLSPQVATVSATGQVTALAVGSASIRATVDGVVGTATVEVSRAPATGVTVTLAAGVLQIGETTNAVAIVRTTGGVPLTGRPVQWSSTDPAVASVSATGAVTALAAGTTFIAAQSDDVTGSAQLRVVSDPPNLTLDNVTMTQVVQRYDGSIPLVANGLPVLVSVFGTVDRPYRPGLPVPRVRITVSEGAVERLVDERALTGFIGPTSGPDQPIHQIIVPGGVVQAGLRISARINPDGVLPEASATDNSWPRGGGSQAIPVVAVPPLEVHFVPIMLTNGGSVGRVDDASLSEYLYATRQWHPVSGIEASIGQTVTSDVAFGSGQSPAWLTLLQQVDLVRVMEGTSKYYIGSVRPPPGITFVEFGGFGYVPASPTGIGPSTRTAVVVGVGWFSRQRHTTETVAHELGHNMGRRHAPCGNPAGPDPAFPYQNASIGQWGYDLYTYSLGGSGLPPAFAPQSASDFMSYCTPAWISDYTYAALLAWRGGPVAASARIVPGGSACECLIVWGSTDGNSLRLGPAFVTRARVALPSRPGAFTVTGEGDDGTAVFAYSFEPAEIDHAPGARHFTFAIPLTPSQRGALARIRVSGGGRSAVLATRPGPGTPGAPLSDGRVRVTRVGAGQVEVAWDRTEFPFVIARDAGTGAVLALGSGGRLVARTLSDEIDVVVSDGVRSRMGRMRLRQ
jgi:hypothetical protein